MFRDFLRGDNKLLLVFKVNKQSKERVDNGRKCCCSTENQTPVETIGRPEPHDFSTRED